MINLRVAVLSDDVFCSEGCEAVLSRIFDSGHIQRFNDPDQLWEHLSMVDLILFDARIASGAIWKETLSTINKKRPNAPVCLLSNFESNRHIKAAFEIGVKGYLHSGASLSEASETIRSVVQGRTVFPEILWKSQKPTVHPLLTPKQTEIMNYLQKGYSNKLIADSLSLSVATVKKHVSNIFIILGVNNRTEAVNVFNKKSTNAF